MAERMNNFNGKEWLQHSFTIWREIKKTQEENKLKHPAMFPSALAEKLINIYTKDNEGYKLSKLESLKVETFEEEQLNFKNSSVKINAQKAKNIVSSDLKHLLEREYNSCKYS